MAEELQKKDDSFSLENIISTAVKIPGVKVSRTAFLEETFKDYPDKKRSILDEGPIAAGISEDELQKKAKRLILVRTSESSIMSFAAGIPGGLLMAATVPADVLQFFGMSIRLAQELSYLYGARDLFDENQVVDEHVRNQLIMYIGVMFGVSGTSAGVRVLSVQIAKTALKKLPQKALTKTVWYPIVKKIASSIGVRMTKTIAAKGIAKVIPIVGGIITGGLTFASMMPMANRLQETLNKACFHYSEEEFYKDLETIENASSDFEEEANVQPNKIKAADVFNAYAKTARQKASSFINKVVPKKEKDTGSKTSLVKEEITKEDVFADLERLKKLYDTEVITRDEFESKKEELLKRI
ncbi:MAG: bacteriochlorophyll 4-vinyl reductase [Firmicutes bacterium]|nr:bacteriochlorophyll 4-vinyl reductase [Bacillota bacterium]